MSPFTERDTSHRHPTWHVDNMSTTNVDTLHGMSTTNVDTIDFCLLHILVKEETNFQTPRRSVQDLLRTGWRAWESDLLLVE